MGYIPTLVAIFLAALIVPTSIYSIQNPNQGSNILKPEDIALKYVKYGPTFSFDGIATTLNVTDVSINKSNPPQYVVTVGFQCLHGGYGDRAGQMLTKAITPHVMVVNVADGEVTEAVVDGSWDELSGKPIQVASSKDVVERIALDWLVNAPTFKFDGVAGSAKVVDSWLAMTFRAPGFWRVTIEFDCLYAGYGDRTSLMLTQVITHHTVDITVTEGKVTAAVVDDKWDEFKQVDLTPPSVILSPEEARDIAIKYVIQKFSVEGTSPNDWVVEDLTPKGLLGSQKTRYTSGDWVVTVEYAVVWKPSYNVTVDNGSEISWMGSVDQSGSLQTAKSTGPNVPQIFYTPEIARTMCIGYLVANHPEVKVQQPSEWTETNLVPQGIVGITKVQYTSGGGTVTVKAPVVWKPTYTVSINYAGPEGSFTWDGILPQGGPVSETSFSK
ncbi:MAG: hypothetical protein ABSA11_14440 [Candidatus Bathyarchaeia archaeon]|jgi:hypothetical protein